MKYRSDIKLIEMTNDDLILFAVKFLGADKNYYYFNIYNDEKIIGEIYAYISFDDVDYFFNIYIDKEFRTEEVISKVLIDFEYNMYLGRDKVRRLFIDTSSEKLGQALLKSNFRISADFASGAKRYMCKEYMYRGYYIEKPNMSHEHWYKRYLEKNKLKDFRKFDYNKWLNSIEKENDRDYYFLMFYNDYLNDMEIVGIGYVLKNWKKENCIYYEIDKNRRDTDFGKYFFEMLFEKLNEDAEFFTISCDQNDIWKIKEYDEVLKYLTPRIYTKDKKIYYETILIIE